MPNASHGNDEPDDDIKRGAIFDEDLDEDLDADSADGLDLVGNFVVELVGHGQFQHGSKWLGTLTSPILLILGPDVPPRELFKTPKNFRPRTPRGGAMPFSKFGDLAKPCTFFLNISASTWLGMINWVSMDRSWIEDSVLGGFLQKKKFQKNFGLGGAIFWAR